jgi:hypothetical protein
MTDDQDVVLMIKDDGLLHVGARGALLDHLLENPQGPAPGIDVFDRVGQRQKLVEQPDGAVTLEPDGDPPDTVGLQLLLDRIDLVLARWQVLLDTDPPEPTDGSAPPKRVLRVTGELPQVVDALHTLFPTLPSANSPTPGNYWHRVAHKLGVAH